MNRDSHIVEIELEKIVPNRFQPRKTFSDDISELAESIRAHGVLQPITVRPLGEKYEIIMGERRYRACEKLGMLKIPCIVANMSDRESMEIALAENLQRQNLSPIEEALSYKRVLEAGYITQQQLAQKMGSTESTISNKLKLLSLDREVQNALLKGEISERHARILLTLEDKEQQRQLLNKIVTEKLTVKRTEEEIKKMEKESFDTRKDNDIEIMDFKEEMPHENVVSVKPLNDVEIENQYSEIISNDRPVQNNQKKSMIPSMGIIDDLESNNARPTIASNHSYDTFEFENIKDEDDSDTELIQEFTNNKPIQAGSREPIQGFSNDKPVQVENHEPVPEVTFATKNDNVNEEALESDKILTNIEPDEIDFSSSFYEDKTSNDVDITQKTGDFSQIAAVIEKCQNEIKALGYKLELEKFDFESMYQVTFKIHKN